MCIPIFSLSTRQPVQQICHSKTPTCKQMLKTKTLGSGKKSQAHIFFNKSPFWCNWLNAMFVLTKFKYTAKIPASDFGKDFVRTLIDRINADFANYVGVFWNLSELQFLGCYWRWSVHHILWLWKNRRLFLYDWWCQ